MGGHRLEQFLVRVTLIHCEPEALPTGQGGVVGNWIRVAAWESVCNGNVKYATACITRKSGPFLPVFGSSIASFSRKWERECENERMW